MTLLNADLWKRLSPMLDELLELPPPARAARLEALREREPALAHEAAQLLAAGDRVEATRFLEGVAMPEVAAPSLEGTRIGAYIVDELLGQGGTGSVWRAHRADGRFDGAVAIKLLHLSLVGRAGALRFEREGAILARLTHPNIARLLDAGVTPGGQPFLVLDVIDGDPIDRWCDKRRLGVEQRLLLFEHVLAAVAHAHSHLVIHRDIKPSNILVDANGTVKLLDFGIARMVEERTEGMTVTAAGQRALTPQYAAPEQLQGAAVTTATDLYALGVLLYGLLVDRHPTSPDGGSVTAVMRAVTDTEPVPLAAALEPRGTTSGADIAAVAASRGTTPARLRAALRGDLENIVARALRKNAGERYPTVSALAEDLRRYRLHQPVSARPDSAAYRFAKLVRRHRSMAAATVLVMLTVAAGLVATMTEAHLAERAAMQARQERDNARRQLSYATASAEFIGFLLQEGADQPFTTPELLAHAEPVLERQFADDPAMRAHLQLILAELYGIAVHARKAEALLVRARAGASEAGDPALLSRVECNLAFRHGMNGAIDQARPLFEAAVARLRAMQDPDRGALAECLQNRSEVATVRGDAQSALADAGAALATLGTPEPGQRTTAIVMRNTLAKAEAAVGRSADAVRDLRRAIDELEAMGRGHTAYASALYNNLGVLLGRNGQALDAVDAYERALAIGRRIGSVIPQLEGNYANRLVELGRASEAMPLIEHAVAEAKARGDRRIGPTLLVQGARAWCLAGELARCGELLADARTELAAILPPAHSTFGALAISEAQLALLRGDPAQARQSLLHSIAIFDAAPDRNRLAIRAVTLLARTEAQLGDLDAAQSHATRAVALARDAMDGFAHSEWLGSALCAQGIVQRARGDTAAARASWRAALAELQSSVGAAAPATGEARRLLAQPLR